MSETKLETKKVDLSSIPNTPKTVVVIPLYGYWSDLPVEQLNYETLQKFVQGLGFSSKYYIKYIFVGEAERLPKDIMNLFVVKSASGAVKFLDIPSFSVYADYLLAGLNDALNDDSVEFIVFANPWIYLGWNVLEKLIDNLHSVDYGIVSGSDRKDDGLTPEEFLKSENIHYPDRLGISRDLFGFSRTIGGLVLPDENYKTPYFVAVDIWGQLHALGQESIKIGDLSYYSFDVDFSSIEPEENFEEDKNWFQKKWGFLPNDIKYK